MTWLCGEVWGHIPPAAVSEEVGVFYAGTFRIIEIAMLGA